MLAKDVMSRKPEFLPPTATIKEAATKMLAHDYGFVPIGENDRLIGAITDRDIVTRALANGKDVTKITLRDVMSKGIQYCLETDDISQVAQKMEKLQIRRLVVLNKDKRMTGIISLGDIAIKAKNPKLCNELIDAVSHH